MGYILGISLILAAIIYLFASNWPGFDRYTKIGLSIGLVVLFYGLAMVLTKFFIHRGFLSEIVMFSGSIAFGVSLALLGQIYNSHANNYILFVIWAIPTLLFSVITKYQPFYILSFILVHLAVWFYLFPSSSLAVHFIHVFRTFTISTAFINMLLFWSVEKRYFNSKSLGLLSFIVFHMAMMIVSTGQWLDPFSTIMSIIYGIILVLWFVYYIKLKVNQTYAVFLGILATVFILIKFFTFLNHIGSQYVYFFTSFIPVLLIIGTLIAIKKLSNAKSTLNYTLLKQIMVGIVITISSVIAASSITGILFGIIGNVPQVFPYTLALIMIIFGLWMTSWHQIVRYTLILTGGFIGGPAAIAYNMVAAIILIMVIALIFWKVRHHLIQSLAYLAIMLLIVALFFKEDVPKNNIVLCLVIINTLVFFIRKKLPIYLHKIFRNNSYIYGMLALFIWTFFHQDYPIIYFIINGAFFLLATIVLYLTLNRYLLLFRVTVVFWFGYIIYKYYDTLWSLLNKSVTFSLIGFTILVITYIFDDRRVKNEDRASFIHRKWLPLVLIVILQLSIITIQIGKNEYLLSHGTTVQLAVVPVDPRSFIQGDYLRLRYTISNINLDPAPYQNQKVSIALVKNKDGLYTYSGIFWTRQPPKEKNDNILWINGRYLGNNRVDYGIENYFIPEASGLNQTQVQYAYVKVSENGNAILVSIK